MTVLTGTIIEALDVVVDLSRGKCPACVDALLDPLLLQTAKEGFGHCVVPTVATPTHAGFQVVRPAKAPPCIAATLRPLIGMNQGVFGLASPHSHDERVQHEVLGQRGLGRPADDAARIEIHYDGQIEPAFPRAHILEVSDPDGVQP